MSSDVVDLVDWAAVRADFPTLAQCTFLNTATYGAMSRRSQAAAIAHFTRLEELAASDLGAWFDDADRLRGKIAALINAQADDIAFVPNAASALSLLMANAQWDEGDEILALENEFPNNLYYPSLLARNGVIFREVPWSRLMSSITAHTRLVLLSTVNYLNGFRPPLEELAAVLRRRNILFFVDGTQSVGALQMDVATLQPDMLVAHGYKWLLGPSGAGFLYVRPSFRRDLQPHVIGWRSDRNWRNMANLNHGVPELSDKAEKYEGGMLPFALMYALEASIDLMLELRPACIESRVLALSGHLRERLREMGGRLESDERPHFESPIVTVRFPGRDAGEIAESLRQKRIFVSARHGNLRISTHFYNNHDDLECVLHELQRS